MRNLNPPEQCLANMRNLNLPEQFLANMKQLLEEEYDAFLSSFRAGRRNALRVNRLKISPQLFASAAPFPVERVPWAENGFYVDYRDYPGQHPWYRAGLYYLQEPSAMAPAQILPVSPGDRVLDLCAAPGGKATELGARLEGKGILVANEISSSRVRALERNIELSGITNCIVSNEAPGRLLERFAGYFDRVLVDAPCSGEGMFRKDPEAAKAWYPDKPEECARVQREIILQAADMLRPGGYLVYSTCTFEPVENELVIAHLLRARPGMELARIPVTGGRESFSKGYSLEELIRRGCAGSCRIRHQEADAEASEEGILSGDLPDLTGTVRIWPHRAGGEGHFIALLRKKETQQSGARPEKKRSAGASDRARAGKSGASKQDLQLIRQFLEKYAPDLKIDMNRCEIREGRVFLMPQECPDVRGLKFLRAGLYLGDLKKNRFEPSQELAMALPGAGGCCMQDAGSTQPQALFPDCGSGLPAGGTGSPGWPADGIMDDGIHITIPSADERLAAFLKGEAIRPENAGESGWRLVCADLWPVGWGKLAGGILKNHIPAGWRNRK